MPLSPTALATLIKSKLNDMSDVEDGAGEGVDNFAKAMAEAIVEHITANAKVTCICSQCGGGTVS